MAFLFKRSIQKNRQQRKHTDAQPAAAQRTKRLSRPRSRIRWKLLTTMMGLIIGLVVTLTAIELVLQKKSLENELNKRIELMKANLLERGSALSNLLLAQVENDVASFNFSHIKVTLDNAVKESPLLTYGILMNTEGVVFIDTAHPDLQQEVLDDEPSRFALAQHNLTHREYPALNITEFILPIHFSNKLWGVLRLGLTMQDLQKEIARSKDDIAATIHGLLLSTAATAAFFILSGSVLVLVISTTLSRPLMRLTESVRELTRGHYDTAMQLLDAPRKGSKRKPKTEDEIGVLAHSFADMANEIRQSHRQLEEYNRNLELKVKERTLELERANEKLKELDQMKTNFLSTVSHELRTPLTSVMGFASILQKEFESTLFPPLSQSEDKKVKRAIRHVMEYAKIIVEEGERLTTLINDVLDLAKMEAGRVDWNMQELKIENIIDRAMTATTALFVNKPVQLRKDIPADLPLIVGDRDRLIQVVINLISNAVKFTDQGSVTCSAAIDGNALRIGVRDTGCGIKAEDQPLVFEKFKQVGDTLTDKPQGTGLGLPICREIIEYHGGRLWLESELGTGSTFLFTLPVPASETAEDSGAELFGDVCRTDFAGAAERLQACATRRRERPSDYASLILIIDDDLNIRQFIRQELSGEGYRVNEAGNGKEGLAAIVAEPPDLIVLDVKMPHLNGFDVAARLHAHPATLGIPIILHTVSEDKKFAEQLGIDCFLTKPVNGSVLLKAVRELLQAPSRKTIVLLDADAERRTAWNGLLEQCGYQVYAVDDAETALASAATYHPQLLIADAALAESGDLVERLRRDKNQARLFFTLLDNEPS